MLYLLNWKPKERKSKLLMMMKMVFLLLVDKLVKEERSAKSFLKLRKLKKRKRN